MTTVTGASGLPHIGSLLEMGMGESLSSHVPAAWPLSAVISPAPWRCEYPHIKATPARKQRRKPTMATPGLTPPEPSDDTVGEFLFSSDMTDHLLTCWIASQAR